jgi:hypothetical protein
MLYINNPEALVAMETERRGGLGLRLAAEPEPALSVTVPEGNRPRRRDLRIRNRAASTGYAAS